MAANIGLLPTTRGFAGNIVLGDIIVAVDNKPVSFLIYLNGSQIILSNFTIIGKILLNSRGSNCKSYI